MRVRFFAIKTDINNCNLGKGSWWKQWWCNMLFDRKTGFIAGRWCTISSTSKWPSDSKLKLS